MAFLMKLHEIQKELDGLNNDLSEAVAHYKADGISDEEVLKIITGLSDNISPLSDGLRSWLEDKQSLIEELEYLTQGFKMEYGASLDYKKFAIMINNKDLKSKLIEFGNEEREHASRLSGFIYEQGGVPEFTIVAEKKKTEIDPETLFDLFIEQEKTSIAYYQKGEERFQDANFCWLLGKIKLEEKDHMGKLEELKAEFKEKEIIVSVDPDFKWADPLMGEPGDRAWIE